MFAPGRSYQIADVSCEERSVGERCNFAGCIRRIEQIEHPQHQLAGGPSFLLRESPVDGLDAGSRMEAAKKRCQKTVLPRPQAALKLLAVGHFEGCQQ